MWISQFAERSLKWPVYLNVNCGAHDVMDIKEQTVWTTVDDKDFNHKSMRKFCNYIVSVECSGEIFVKV